MKYDLSWLEKQRKGNIEVYIDDEIVNNDDVLKTHLLGGGYYLESDVKQYLRWVKNEMIKMVYHLDLDNDKREFTEDKIKEVFE